jgi:hypothetical protein
VLQTDGKGASFEADEETWHNDLGTPGAKLYLCHSDERGGFCAEGPGVQGRCHMAQAAAAE